MSRSSQSQAAALSAGLPTPPHTIRPRPPRPTPGSVRRRASSRSNSPPPASCSLPKQRRMGLGHAETWVGRRIHATISSAEWDLGSKGVERGAVQSADRQRDEVHLSGGTAVPEAVWAAPERAGARVTCDQRGNRQSASEAALTPTRIRWSRSRGDAAPSDEASDGISKRESSLRWFCQISDHQGRPAWGPSRSA